MAIVRASRGELLFFNAVPLPEEALRQLASLGTPKALIVPNLFHGLDAAAFAERLALTVYVPDVSVAELGARFACQPASTLTFPEVSLHVVEGFKTKELVLEANGTLVTADLVTNSRHGRGFNGLLMRLIGFTGPEPKLPKPVRVRVQTDRLAVQRLLRALADRPGLVRLIPTHGELVEGDVARVLRAVADGI